MENNTLRFVLDGRITEIDFVKENILPSTTVLNYLRSLHGHTGTREGCAEGDCGACTVVVAEAHHNTIRYKAVDSCLLFLPAIHGKQLITVENLAIRNPSEDGLHPVQKALVTSYGSQCGFCTPGIVMALFAMYKNQIQPSRENMIQCLTGNLCRCTGYQPIYEAASAALEKPQADHFSANENHTLGLLTEIRNKGMSLIIRHPSQTYFLLESIEEALKIRRLYPNAIVVNGATDTAIRQNKTHQYPGCILDISAVPALKQWNKESGGWYIGSGVSIENLKHIAGEYLQWLMPILDVFASWQIRNVATLGGNLATTSPVGDLIPLLIASKAKVRIISENDARWAGMDDFITGYRTNCLASDELIAGILIPLPEPGTLLLSEKISSRKHLDISTLSLTMRILLSDNNIVEDILLAYGGMADRPKRASAAENFIKGKKWEHETIEKAIPHLENDFAPISDARAGADYRRLASANLLRKLFLKSTGEL
jgi:xanthine dehydrogenase small subunit